VTPRKPVRIKKARRFFTCPQCGRRILVGQYIASVGHGPWRCAAHLLTEGIK
jgi:hypothetical protein